MDYISAIILGIVEGISEFLPISSTGHLILASKLLSIEQSEFTKSFEIVIQMGAILSIIIIYFKRLVLDIKLIKLLLLGFLPAGIIGFLFSKFIKLYLFNHLVVCAMLILWGVIFIVIENILKNKRTFKQEIDYKTAFLIGLFQCFALIPGTSRSGATIVGGMICGLSRRNATEFSFLLSVPTIVIASIYEAYKDKEIIFSSNFQILAIGFITSFIFAYISVNWLLKFVSRHSLVAFGIYRIIIGIVFLIALKF